MSRIRVDWVADTLAVMAAAVAALGIVAMPGRKAFADIEVDPSFCNCDYATMAGNKCNKTPPPDPTGPPVACRLNYTYCTLKSGELDMLFCYQEAVEP